MRRCDLKLIIPIPLEVGPGKEFADGNVVTVMCAKLPSMDLHPMDSVFLADWLSHDSTADNLFVVVYLRARPQPVVGHP